MMKLLKKEIKRIILGMKVGESIEFQSHSTDTNVKRHGLDNFSLKSRGQGWCDQIREEGDTDQIVKWIWTDKPHSAY